MTDHTTPLLRDALARALEAALLSPLDDPPVPTVDRVLHALANDPEVMAAVALALDGSFFSYPSRSPRRNARDALVAVLFGEAR